MSLQAYLDVMGIQNWALKSKTQATYLLVSDEDYAMSEQAQALLHAMLASIELDQEQVLTSESLKKQMAVIQPRLLLVLGARAAHELLKCNTSIEDLRGKIYTFANTPAIITYHPEYLLLNPKYKRHTYQDLCVIQNILHHL